MTDDKPTCTAHYWPNAHDGGGYYYVDDEYEDEGSIGAFNTMDELEAHATEAGYRVVYASPLPEAAKRE